MRFLKLSIIIPLALAVLVFPVLAGNVALAIDEGTKQAACEGIGLVGPDCEETDADSEVNSIVATIVNIFSWIVGVAAVIMIIVGGFKYITSNGDSNKIASAKTTIIYAIVGLVIVALSQFIVRFALDTATTNPPAEQTNTDSRTGPR